MAARTIPFAPFAATVMSDKKIWNSGAEQRQTSETVELHTQYGRPWTDWVESAKKRTALFREPEQQRQTRQQVLLPRRDVRLYGIYPASDWRWLVKCEKCSAALVPAAIPLHRRCSARCPQRARPVTRSQVSTLTVSIDAVSTTPGCGSNRSSSSSSQYSRQRHNGITLHNRTSQHSLSEASEGHCGHQSSRTRGADDRPGRPWTRSSGGCGGRQLWSSSMPPAGIALKTPPAAVEDMHDHGIVDLAKSNTIADLPDAHDIPQNYHMELRYNRHRRHLRNNHNQYFHNHNDAVLSTATPGPVRRRDIDTLEVAAGATGVGTATPRLTTVLSEPPYMIPRRAPFSCPLRYVTSQPTTPSLIEMHVFTSDNSARVSVATSNTTTSAYSHHHRSSGFSFSGGGAASALSTMSSPPPGRTLTATGRSNMVLRHSQAACNRATTMGSITSKVGTKRTHSSTCNNSNIISDKLGKNGTVATIGSSAVLTNRCVNNKLTPFSRQSNGFSNNVIILASTAGGNCSTGKIVSVVVPSQRDPSCASSGTSMVSNTNARTSTVSIIDAAAAATAESTIAGLPLGPSRGGNTALESLDLRHSINIVDDIDNHGGGGGVEVNSAGSLILLANMSDSVGAPSVNAAVERATS